MFGFIRTTMSKLKMKSVHRRSSLLLTTHAVSAHKWRIVAAVSTRESIEYGSSISWEYSSGIHTP